MKTLSLGKWRGLQQCSTARGTFSVLAIDQRGNLRQLLNPDAPTQVSAALMSEFKVEVVSALSSSASAVLLDPEFGAAQAVAAGRLPGLLVALEATGYSGDAQSRESSFLPYWNVEKSKRMGASGVKLLVYYHPDAPSAPQIESLVREAADMCEAAEIPLFLEPLSYSLDTTRKLSSDERKQVVIESARRLTVSGVDVLKAEFPLDIHSVPDEEAWASACEALTEASAAPWVLLSGGVDYDTYLRQVMVACHAGASGVAVGRAVWQEATKLDGDERERFLHQAGIPRMNRITALCDELAVTWQHYYQPPQIEEGWYVRY